MTLLSQETKAADLSPVGDPLVFVHLSDIHFEAGYAGSPDDLNDDVRRQLLSEVLEQTRVLGTPVAVVVSGDIAARGSAVEYEYARRWLDQLCGILGLETDAVWVIPGNHDVDQAAHRGNFSSTLVRQKLQQLQGQQLDDAIRDAHNDPIALAGLYEPLRNYNDFASAYQCAIDGTTRRWWEADFSLGGGYRLTLRGVNSALVSDADDNRRRSVAVGTVALTFPAETGTLHLLMCHHPPHWLADRPVLDGGLGQRAVVQLFGHEHDQNVRQIDSTIRLHSGALHPDRREGPWQPHYNVLSVQVCETEHQAVTVVKVRSRAWSKQLAAFAADNSAPDGQRSYTLSIPRLARVERPPVSNGSSISAGEPTAPERESPEAVTRRLAVRRLIHLFHRLPIPDQWDIVRALDFSDLQQVTRTTSELSAELFARATRDGVLERLWDAVTSKADKTHAASRNPFAGT